MTIRACQTPLKIPFRERNLTWFSGCNYFRNCLEMTHEIGFKHSFSVQFCS
jgi:hypothetical protein